MSNAERHRSLVGLTLLAVGVVLAVAAVDMRGLAQSLAVAVGVSEALVGLALILQVGMSPEPDPVPVRSSCPTCGRHDHR
jgi:Ca2+/H+ antiporter